MTIVLRADQYQMGCSIRQFDMPLVHRVFLAEIERLTERFADAIEARDGIGGLEVADEVSRLRAILASYFRPV